jgi:hypothetical protein
VYANNCRWLEQKNIDMIIRLQKRSKYFPMLKNMRKIIETYCHPDCKGGYFAKQSIQNCF